MEGETNGNAHEMAIENNSQDWTANQSNVEFDENSGKTLSQAGPWFQAIKVRKNKKAPNEDRIQEGGKQGNPRNQQGGLNARSNPRVEASMHANSNQQRQQDQGSPTNGKLPPRRATPPLPDNDYKVWKQNLIIASTADEDYALKLGSINGIELGVATYEMTPYIKPLPGTARGVKQPEPSTTPTPPTEHTPPIEDLESGIEYKMIKARTANKAELRNEFRAELAQAVDSISTSVAATVQAAVQALHQEITQMGNKLSQRNFILGKDKEQARKKLKYPIREAQVNETLGSYDGD
ncbi:hypothetical protein HPB49_009420 [Dermacentor silvarum]|uniref:Uncharacterized protein n=1 Tax=Dermacentor silvarum TaxID=543639 RepID=A0ACB8D428_DERSI|nr:hypothetical protein HPB49_009420 [Dermacentor silvarum]